MDIPESDFRNAPLQALRRIENRTDQFSYVSIAGVPCVYLNDPKLIREVLDTHWPEFRKEFGYKKSRDLIQKDLFSPALIWPSPQEFLTLSAELQSIVKRHVVASGVEVDDLYAWCRRLTMDVFLRTLLAGSLSPSISQKDLEEATMRAIEILGKEILKFPLNIDMLDQLDPEAHSELLEYASMFVQNPACSSATPGRAMTTILAGYEQMASIMFWLILHYAEQPFKDMDGIGNRQFLNEVIRLHSPIWTIMRRPKHDVRLGDCLLPQDSVVITSPWLMARNEKYFPEPDRFLPNRWNEQIDTFAFFPFSHGPRVCKGERFVRATMYALLGELSDKMPSVHEMDDKHHLVRVSVTPKEPLKIRFSPIGGR